MKSDPARISVVTPVYNRHEQLIECLESLCLQDYPRDLYEVIVVDDGSNTPVEAVIRHFRNRLDMRCFVQENQGPAHARNTGVAQATGDLLVFVDDDCRADASWLGALEAAARENPGSAIGGRTINGLPDNPCSTASGTLVTLLYAHSNLGPAGPTFFTSSNLMIPFVDGILNDRIKSWFWIVRKTSPCE